MFDIVVIGGGAGGLTVASGCLQLGLKVALIEKSRVLGGDCLHYGCVPSKSLLHVARVAHDIRNAKTVGLNAALVPVDLGRVNEYVAEVVGKIQQHDDPDRFRKMGGSVLFGQGQFVDANTFKVEGQTIRAKKFVIATGAGPFVPEIPGLKEAGFLTNETVFSQLHLPKKLIILGGGPTGLEMAQAFARLGSQVTVLELAERILPREDATLASALKRYLEQDGVQFYTRTNVKEVQVINQRKVVICEDAAKERFTLDANEILVAIGRRPHVSDLQLSAAGVDYLADGILVDRRLRTSQKNIYALGDVIRCPYKMTHVAEYQAGVVIANLVFKLPKKVTYELVPRVIYTDPEMAQVGLTEQQAIQQKIKNLKVLTFDFKDIDRALTENQGKGQAKLIVKKNQILGASYLGPHAGDLIAEIGLAIQAGARLNDLSATIHAYPTYAQINRRIANTYFGEKLFGTRVKKLVQFLQKLL